MARENRINEGTSVSIMEKQTQLIQWDFLIYRSRQWVNRQLENEIFWPPKLYIKNKYENIADYKLNDFIIKNYKSHDTIKMKMRP